MNSQRLPLPMNTPEASPSLPEQPATAEQPTGAAPGQALTWEEIDNLKNQIVATLCTCFDPEIPVNIYELGLIYDIEIAPTAAVALRMTLTSPACPAAGSLPPEVEHKVRGVPGVTAVKVDVVWDPPWDKSRMSEAAKLQLGIDD
jgi:FeS assembly SUF system protein